MAMEAHVEPASKPIRRLTVLQRPAPIPDAALLTNSAQTTYAKCPRKYLNRYIFGVRKRGTAFNLWFGDVVHKALETYWKARQASGSRVGTREHLEAGLATLPKDADPFVLARLQIMLAAYAARWNPIRCTVLHVELPFDLPLRNPRTKEEHRLYRRAGKIDLILQFANGVVLVEHKTSSEDLSDGGSYQSRLALDEQIAYYHEALESLGMQVTEIIYDVLKKPTLKPIKATPEEKRVYTKVTKKNPESRLRAGQFETDETVEDYKSRLAAKILERPEDTIYQIKIPRTSSQRRGARWDIWSRAEIMRFSIENDYFPMASGACFKFGSACEYLEVCKGTDSLDNPNRFEVLQDLHPELGRAQTYEVIQEEDESESEAEGQSVEGD